MTDDDDDFAEAMSNRLMAEMRRRTPRRDDDMVPKHICRDVLWEFVDELKARHATAAAAFGSDPEMQRRMAVELDEILLELERDVEQDWGMRR